MNVIIIICKIIVSFILLADWLRASRKNLLEWEGDGLPGSTVFSITGAFVFVAALAYFAMWSHP